MADAEDQLVRSSSELTRGDLLKRGTAAAFSISMFGGLTDRALGFYGPLKYAHKQLAGELRIMQWAHFVPAYDQWLDNTYVKRWGEANDTEVKVDHINNALLYSTGASQVAAQSGHDLFWFISPPSTFQKQVVPVTDIVQEVSRKLGPMSRVARKSTYNPRTKQFYGFPDDYAPDPVQYRRSYLQEAGVSLNSWESLRQGAPKLKAIGHPLGLGMSNEIDSNMLLTSLLYCYGGFIQNEENRIVIGQGAPRRGAIQALTVMRDIYRRGMSDEVFAWTAASNNQAFLAGRLSVALNAISIARSAELSGNTPLSDDTWLASIPRGPHMRMGNEHVMGVFVIWKFAKNKAAARKYLIDQQLGYREHFIRSGFYNFPAWTGAIKGGFKEIRRLSAQDTHKPRGKYTVLTTIAEKYTTNPGHPGNTTPVIDEIFNTFLIPQMFAEVAQGKSTPAEAVSDFARKAQGIYRKWRNQGLV
ncbi:MAG TPA: extracellular solute-binding protein [Solirubrobacterales bacterium]|nr:extracellular solute-binding protein [Solirubrobacterales bacterium]